MGSILKFRMGFSFGENSAGFRKSVWLPGSILNFHLGSVSSIAACRHRFRFPKLSFRAPAGPEVLDGGIWCGFDFFKCGGRLGGKHSFGGGLCTHGSCVNSPCLNLIKCETRNSLLANYLPIISHLIWKM